MRAARGTVRHGRAGNAPGGTVGADCDRGNNVLQLTNFGRYDTGIVGSSFIHGGRVIFLASANPTGENPAEICQLFSIDKLALHPPGQLTHFPSDGRRSVGCRDSGISRLSLDPITGTVLFSSSYDPIGGNPFGEQFFTMRADGTGLRQLISARGMTTDPDGTVHVEMLGPVAYYSSRRGS